MGDFKIRQDIQNISKVKVTNFIQIDNEEMVTNVLLLLCLEYIEKYNNGFLPFNKNINGLLNMITCCINFLDDKEQNLLDILDLLKELKEKDNTYKLHYEELLELLEDDADWHLIFSKTFIKIKLYKDILEENKK